MGENVQQVQGVNYVPLQVETVPYATAPYNRVPTVTCTVTETVTVCQLLLCCSNDASA